jgi:hypothetical protein
MEDLGGCILMVVEINSLYFAPLKETTLKLYV